MVQVPETDPIAFLIERKFGPLVLATLPASLARGARSNRTLSPAELAQRKQEVVEYRASLEALPLHQLQSLYEEEHLRLHAEKTAALEREENNRFFNLPSAAADFEHWSKAAHWSLEEAVALAMGKAPEFVSWPTIRNYQSVSHFVFRYARLRDLAQRAVAWQKLFDPVLPIIFVNWTKENDIEFPVALAEKVIERSGHLADWKSLYEQLKIQSDEHIAAWRKIAEDRSVLIETSMQRIEGLNSSLAQCRAELASKSETSLSEKPQSPIEREGMLMVIYAMAVGGYGYQPTAGRSTLISDIVKDLELQGLSLSDDTVRRYIKAAGELLPEWLEKRR